MEGDVRKMASPARCTCGRIYDLGTVEITSRHLDCSVWRAPCCGRTADDRGETGWKTTKDYFPISAETARLGYEVLMDGSVIANG